MPTPYAEQSPPRPLAAVSSPAPPLPWWLRVLASLPWVVLYGAGACLAFLAHRVLRYRLRIVRSNLAGAFPGLGARALRDIESRYYRSLGQLCAEIVKSAGLAPQALNERVTLTEVEPVRRELAAGRCVLLVAAHQCNWEWLLLALSLQLGHPLEAAYKPLHAGYAERLMQALRTRFGGRLTPAKELLARILKDREPRAIAMVADQEPVTSEYKWWTLFLGRPTAFYMGPEKIAQVTRFAVFFTAMRRLERGRYEVRFEALAAAREQLAGGELTERFARCVEAQIRAQPADWMWSHRRWKLRRPMYSATGSALDQGSV
jgi:Kdo2-lipid IVA lauroyltransferase/acyltransferase